MTTGRQACSVHGHTLRMMQREIIDSWQMGTPNMPVSRSNAKATFRLEYVFERSWKRVFTNCSSEPVDEC